MLNSASAGDCFWPKDGNYYFNSKLTSTCTFKIHFCWREKYSVAAVGAENVHKKLNLCLILTVRLWLDVSCSSGFILVICSAHELNDVCVMRSSLCSCWHPNRKQPNIPVTNTPGRLQQQRASSNFNLQPFWRCTLFFPPDPSFVSWWLNLKTSAVIILHCSAAQPRFSSNTSAKLCFTSREWICCKATMVYLQKTRIRRRREQLWLKRREFFLSSGPFGPSRAGCNVSVCILYQCVFNQYILFVRLLFLFWFSLSCIMTTMMSLSLIKAQVIAYEWQLYRKKDIKKVNVHLEGCLLWRCSVELKRLSCYDPRCNRVAVEVKEMLFPNKYKPTAAGVCLFLLWAKSRPETFPSTSLLFIFKAHLSNTVQRQEAERGDISKAARSKINCNNLGYLNRQRQNI